MGKKKRYISISIFIITLLLWHCHQVFPKTHKQRNWSRQIKNLVVNGGVLVWDRNKTTLFALNSDKKFIPASILKLATALAALDYLGEGYSFPTALFIDTNNNLYIKGFGDPFLISEEVDAICEKLIDTTGSMTIKNIYLDDTYFAGLIHVPGTGGSDNPYDALNGALIVNFNTIQIKKDKHGTISSGEEQTPLTPYARYAARGLAPGNHRINLAANPEKSLLYTGELFAAMLAQKGIKQNPGLIKRKRVPDSLAPLFIHTSSSSLPDILRGMMEFSNNFIANQLMLTIGARLEGEPATIAKGVKVFDDFLRNKIGIRDFTLSEGSGLSRENRFSPMAMQMILHAFFPYRNLLNCENGVLCKTGTLTGVSTLAGYYKNKEDQYRQFVIMLNQRKNNRDRIIKLLKENL